MSEHREIEIKFPLENPQAMREALLQQGALLQGRHIELNIRLDDLQRSLTARRIVLRLRRVEEEGEITHILTVKTPVADPDRSFSVRREIEVTVSDGEAMLAALSVLGYVPYWRYEKRRETFRLGPVEAVIDEMPFGWFLELEGPKDEIRELAARLGLDLSEGMTLSYAQIFENVRRALNLGETDLTFEAFPDVRLTPEIYRGGGEGDKSGQMR